MITEDYVSFEIAQLLKEKGFDGHTYAYYEDEDNPNISLHASKSINWNKTEFISKPTLQMVMKWLRERRIFIDIFHYNSKFAPFVWMIFAYNKTSPQRAETYEEAAEAAIKYILENWDDVNSVLDEYYKVDKKLPMI